MSRRAKERRSCASDGKVRLPGTSASFLAFAGYRHLSGNGRNASRLAAWPRGTRSLPGPDECRLWSSFSNRRGHLAVPWRLAAGRKRDPPLLVVIPQSTVAFLQCLFGGVVAYFRTKSRVNANGGLGPALHARSLCVWVVCNDAEDIRVNAKP
jgi:hypothetical protein